ncbi:unnamed protein product [Symbiodinium sp. CCMP2592]|nr:unnamed protein product [Symbiodinium sp. CCMP2592]
MIKEHLVDVGDLRNLVHIISQVLPNQLLPQATMQAVVAYNQEDGRTSLEGKKKVESLKRELGAGGFVETLPDDVQALFNSREKEPEWAGHAEAMGSAARHHIGIDGHISAVITYVKIFDFDLLVAQGFDTAVLDLGTPSDFTYKDLNSLAGDAWSVPVAGAVIFGVLACVFPTATGKPAVSLKTKPPVPILSQIKLLKVFGDHDDDDHLRDADSMDVASPSASEGEAQDGWDVLSPQSDTATEEDREADLMFASPCEGFCTACASLIQKGEVVISWMQGQRMIMLHASCMVDYASNCDFAKSLFVALVAFEPRAPISLHCPLKDALEKLQELIHADSGSEKTVCRSCFEPEGDCVCDPITYDLDETQDAQVLIPVLSAADGS